LKDGEVGLKESALDKHKEIVSNMNASLLAACLSGLYTYLYSTDRELDKSKVCSLLERPETKKIILDEVMNIDAFVALLDKDAHYKQAVKLFLDAYGEDGVFSQTRFFAVLDQLIHKLSDDHKMQVYQVITAIVLLDKNVDDSEKEFLIQFSTHFNLNKDVNDIINQCIVTKVRRREKWFSFVMMLAVLCVGAFFGYQYLNPSPPDIRFGKLVFDKVHFNRYVMAGNFRGGSQNIHLGKAAVYYMEGTADVQFDFSKVSLIDCEHSSINSNMKCQAVFKLPEVGIGQSIPYEIDVTVDRAIEAMRVDPTPISESEAKKVGLVAGAVLGASGAYMGAKVGSQSGEAIGKIAGMFAGSGFGGSKIVSMMGGQLGSIALGGMGAVVAGGALGAGGYVVTKNLVTGITLTNGISEQDKINVIEMAKRLTAADLMRQELLERYQKDFERTLRELYKPYGIIIKGIRYE